VLPPPAQIFLRARFVSDRGEELERFEDVTLADLLDAAESHNPHLMMSALDLVAQANPADTPQRSALETRLMALLDLQRPAGAEDGVLELILDRRDDWGPHAFGIVETFEIAKGLRDLFGQGRALAPADFAVAGGPSGLTVNSADLLSRAAAAGQALTSVAGALAAAATGSASVVRQALFAADSLGVPATPVSLRDPSDASEQAADLARLRRQAAAAAAEVARRQGMFDSAAADDPTARLKGVFGDGFLVLPGIIPAGEIAGLYKAGAAPAGADTPAARTWLSRAARVRENVRKLDEVLGYADAVGESVSGRVRALFGVAQLGGPPGERWAALPLARNTSMPGGRTSVVAVMPLGTAPAAQIAGLLVDDWVEVVPNASETTSVAFHYDAPTSTPPQVMLIGVPYPNQERWTSADVIGIVEEALALARIRMVDIDTLPGLGQLLPAFVTAESATSEIAGLGIEALTRPETS
jgi:hypothetical protein